MPTRCSVAVAIVSLLTVPFAASGPFAAAADSAPDPANVGRAAPKTTDDFTLRLGGMAFDPLATAPAVEQAWRSPDHDECDLRLVQMTGATQASWIADLEQHGLQIVQYIDPHCYVVWGTKEDLAATRQLGSVRWADDFHPAYRVLPAYRALHDAPVDARVTLYRGADTDDVVRQITDLGAVLNGRSAVTRTFERAAFTVPGDRFAEIASIPGVYCIRVQPTDGGLRGEMSDQINVGNYDGSNVAFPGYETWLASVGLSGAGVILANVDGGVQNNHPDLISRLIACSGVTCGGSATSSHGTHTAGIMVADGASGTLDSYGFLRGLGVAPGADLVEQVYSPWFTQPGGMYLLMSDSVASGAIASGNSWGPSGSPQGYDDDTMQVDVGARDTDPNTPGDQPLLFVLSIMNGNGGTSSQGSPDEAKNIFTIGSTKMQNSGGSQILDINDISSNSAHGPCLDGRKIPHMVAPGCSVDSSTSSSGYTTMCGTSMASPHVTGAVGLFVEYYRNLAGYTVDPSPALVKAAFLPAAHDLAGFRDADGGTLGHRFDNKQGWGRMNLEAVVDPTPNSVRYFDNPVIFGNTGEEWSIDLSPLDPELPVRIMLVWTDAPGHGLGGSTPAWNNDLDLVVSAGGQTFYGNRFGANGWSVTGGAPDGQNNTEGVFLGPTPPGVFTIRIVASDINSDGLPNSGDLTDQDFALVCYNVAEEPGFGLTVAPTSQDICAPSDAVYSVESVQILGYNEPITLTATGEPSGTTVTFVPNPIVPGNASTMTVSGTGAAPAGNFAIEITGTTVDLVRTANAGLDLATSVPSTVSLIDPVNGAADVSVVPSLSWAPAAQADTYRLRIATDPGFANVVYTQIIADTAHAVESALDSATVHYWTVGGINACGDGNDAAVFSFTTQDIPAVLLVDDDDNSPDVRATYTAALDALGIWYDVWDTNNSDNEPTATDLAPYRTVIWFTGDEFGGSSGPGSAGETALSTWLDAGGCLMISSQDYHWDRGLTSFMQEYLGVSSVGNDVGQGQVTGQGSVFGSFGSYSLNYPFTDYSDRVTPGASGELAFSGSAGDAGVDKDGGVYRTTFWGFPFEAIPTANQREELLGTFLEWCNGLLPQCPADIDGDGVVGFTDLLAILAEWGPCGACPEDIDESGAVDFNDLLIVLGEWGDCDG